MCAFGLAVKLGNNWVYLPSVLQSWMALLLNSQHLDQYPEADWENFPSSHEGGGNNLLFCARTTSTLTRLRQRYNELLDAASARISPKDSNSLKAWSLKGWNSALPINSSNEDSWIYHKEPEEITCVTRSHKTGLKSLVPIRTTGKDVSYDHCGLRLTVLLQCPRTVQSFEIRNENKLHVAHFLTVPVYYQTWSNIRKTPYVRMGHTHYRYRFMTG